MVVFHINDGSLWQYWQSLIRQLCMKIQSLHCSAYRATITVTFRINRCISRAAWGDKIRSSNIFTDYTGQCSAECMCSQWFAGRNMHHCSALKFWWTDINQAHHRAVCCWCTWDGCLPHPWRTSHLHTAALLWVINLQDRALTCWAKWRKITDFGPICSFVDCSNSRTH